jgi:hypothetical protein
MKRIFSLMAIFAVVVMMSGCAGTCQRMKANGSLVGTTTGDWVVIKQSGGHITDVYLLDNVFVQSEQGSDGWLFIDQDGNPVHIGGDMKAIRVTTNKQQIFANYVEYHSEHDNMTYHEKLALRPK